MKWQKPDEELGRLLEASLASFNVRKKKMFGFPAYFVNDNMLAGVFEDKLFLRMPEKDRQEMAGGIRPFEPVSGRTMREYVVLPASVYGNPDKLGELLEHSYAYASSLPQKKGKRKKRD
ncbi:MAG TPA: TfoX/Sxy family protein [Candidatus Methanoperedenaceae archaeon]|nr:TfoX/Sxy family protein [Candidatus Methanoperedenaceae archaeon]